MLRIRRQAAGGVQRRAAPEKGLFTASGFRFPMFTAPVKVNAELDPELDPATLAHAVPMEAWLSVPSTHTLVMFGGPKKSASFPPPRTFSPRAPAENMRKEKSAACALVGGTAGQRMRRERVSTATLGRLQGQKRGQRPGTRRLGARSAACLADDRVELVVARQRREEELGVQTQGLVTRNKVER